MAAPEPTIDVQVKFMGDLPAVVGRRMLDLTMPEGRTVGDLLQALSETYGDAFTSRVFAGPAKLEHTILIFVDGEDIRDCGGIAAKLGKGRVELIMLPMFGGG